MAILWFVVGLLVGNLVGLFTASLMCANTEERNEQHHTGRLSRDASTGLPRDRRALCERCKAFAEIGGALSRAEGEADGADSSDASRHGGTHDDP